METSELAKQLSIDAAQEVPPFGAQSVQMARQLGPAATEFLLERIRGKGAEALLALEALREADPAAYETLPARQRAEVYVAALRNNRFFNAWGLPSHQLTETARSLIGLGEEAIVALKPLLRDQRSALLSGSQDATTSRAYGNRVCDYALALINKVRHPDFTFSKDPIERDNAIASLQRDLEAPTK